MSMSATEDRKSSAEAHPEMGETFEALEGVADLRPLSPHGNEKSAPVDTSRLMIATGELAELKGSMAPRELARRMAAKKRADEAHAANNAQVTPSYKRRPWHHNGQMLVILGITGILAAGLLTLIALLLAGMW